MLSCFWAQCFYESVKTWMKQLRSIVKISFESACSFGSGGKCIQREAYRCNLILAKKSYIEYRQVIILTWRFCGVAQVQQTDRSLFENHFRPLPCNLSFLYPNFIVQVASSSTLFQTQTRFFQKCDLLPLCPSHQSIDETNLKYLILLCLEIYCLSGAKLSGAYINMTSKISDYLQSQIAFPQ